MPANFLKPDSVFGTLDLDDEFVTDAWLVDKYTGNGLVGFGYNFYGCLGLDDATNRSSPVQVGLLTTWQQVTAGNGHVAAVKTDGTLWTWGFNPSGQIGRSDLTYRSSPVQVGSLTNWRQVTAGQNFTAAVKTDGTLWTWGGNSNGPLGDGTNVNKSSPVQVGLLTNWKQVSAAAAAAHIAAIKTDGTMWTWGYNLNGQLGDGTTTTRSSPVQVGILTNWRQVACGSAHTAAVKTDGTLWTCGYNAYGQLGNNDAGLVSRSSPVQVGALTNWRQVAAGGRGNAVVKTDGTLWACGYNGQGQLGDGTIVNKSSPVQVGSLTNWRQVTYADNHVAALQYNDLN